MSTPDRETRPEQLSQRQTSDIGQKKYWKSPQRQYTHGNPISIQWWHPPEEAAAYWRLPRSFEPLWNKRTPDKTWSSGSKTISRTFENSWISDQDQSAFSKDAADDFLGMVSYLRDCCEDASKQMASLKGRLAVRAEMKNLIRNELQLLTQERLKILLPPQWRSTINPERPWSTT